MPRRRRRTFPAFIDCPGCGTEVMLLASKPGMIETHYLPYTDGRRTRIGQMRVTVTVRKRCDFSNALIEGKQKALK